MLFPFQKSQDERLDKDFVDPAARIDRHLADRTRRLTAGLAIDGNFEAVSAALLVTRGRGKYVRVNHARCLAVPIPESLQNDCLELQGESKNRVTVEKFAHIQHDLAQIQAAAAERLKTLAGKYVDRMMTLAVSDPGYWSLDFDGQPVHTSVCDGTKVAELSGLNVIDSFPSRDLAVSGTGMPLSPLPIWMLLADRNPRVANATIAFFDVNQTVESLILPPSDGLDSELPPIQYFRSIGTSLLETLLRDFLPKSQQAYDVSKLYANGKKDETLIGLWKKVVSKSLDTVGSMNPPNAIPHEVVGQCLKIALGYQSSNQIAISTLLRSATAMMVDALKTKAHQASKQRTHLDRIWVSSDQNFEACIINEVQQSFPHSEIKSVSDLGFDNKSITAAIAAILGLMHIDQMPSNVPWLTGASSQRILGRLTPGRPSCWRQLLMDMADFQPPAMKLKDAI